MARRYNRDAKGRFASTGGGGGRGKKAGGGGKAASSRATNTARAKQLQAGGTTAIGGRIKAKGFAGGKAAQQRAGGLRSRQTKQLKVKATKGVGTRAAMKAGAVAASKARSKAASKGATKMSKAAPNAAKARYKELSGQARKASAFRTAAENRKAAGAKRSLATMIKKRGR